MTLWDMMKDIPVSAALAERIKMADAEIGKLAKENAEFKKENANLLAKNTELMEIISKTEASHNQFEEYAGVKFKKVPGGSDMENMPLCPKCCIALYIDSIGNRRTHKCSSCGFIAPFTVRQFHEMIKNRTNNKI